MVVARVLEMVECLLLMWSQVFAVMVVPRSLEVLSELEAS